MTIIIRAETKKCTDELLLIEPTKASSTIGGKDVFLYGPLALEYIAEGEVSDHEVRILDLRLEKNLTAKCDWVHQA